MKAVILTSDLWEKTMQLSKSEEIIYSILLKAGRDLTVQEIMEQAKICFGREWKFQTVATFLERMKKKGCVSVCKIGRYSHFHPKCHWKITGDRSCPR